MNKNETWDGLREFPVAGRYFELLSVVNPVDVRAFAAGDRVVADERACPAGYFIDRRDRDPFERIEITTGALETVKFLITDGMSGQRGAPSSSTIIAPLLSDNADGQAVGNNLVGVVARLQAFNGAQFDRLQLSNLGIDSGTSARVGLLTFAVQAGINGVGLDRIRADDVGGPGAQRVTERGFKNASVQKAQVLLGAGVTEAVFVPASNTNGAIVWDAEAITASATSNGVFLAFNTAAPTNFANSGTPILVVGCHLATAVGQVAQRSRLGRAVFVPAGNGLWWMNETAVETFARRRCLYTLL